MRDGEPSLLSEEAVTPRPGEGLDAARLEPWLRQALHLRADVRIELAQFPGGHSNLTYLVRVGERELVLRRPPFGSTVKHAHDMVREARVLSRLAPVWPLAPRPLAVCEDEALLGGKFYVMERVRGLVLRRHPPPALGFGADVARRLSLTLVDALAALHALDHRAIGLADFGRPDGYLARQVDGWTRRWHDAATEPQPLLERVALHLARTQPASPAAAVVHNDFKHDNVIVDPRDPTRLLAVVDWELATIGDPLSDFGTALAYWVEATDPEPLRQTRFGPTTCPGTPTRRELAARYAERSGRDLSGVAWYYVFGLFKIAVILQQIYRRYRLGLTHDERFARLGEQVRVLAETAQRAADRDDL